jgi:hypothetical protein
LFFSYLFSILYFSVEYPRGKRRIWDFKDFRDFKDFQDFKDFHGILEIFMGF